MCLCVWSLTVITCCQQQTRPASVTSVRCAGMSRYAWLSAGSSYSSAFSKVSSLLARSHNLCCLISPLFLQNSNMQLPTSFSIYLASVTIIWSCRKTSNRSPRLVLETRPLFETQLLLEVLRYPWWRYLTANICVMLRGCDILHYHTIDLYQPWYGVCGMPDIA